MTSVPAGTDRPCEKCGSEDIYTAYHRPGCGRDVCSCVTCSYGSNAKEHGEHLHRHCRGCQYDWIDPVRAASPVSVTADQEAGDE